MTICDECDEFDECDECDYLLQFWLVRLFKQEWQRMVVWRQGGKTHLPQACGKIDRDAGGKRNACDWHNACDKNNTVYVFLNLRKLIWPQATWLSIFYRKINSVWPPLGTWLSTHHCQERVEKKKAQHPLRFEHTTSLFQDACSTAVQQQMPNAVFFISSRLVGILKNSHCRSCSVGGLFMNRSYESYVPLFWCWFDSRLWQEVVGKS